MCSMVSEIDEERYVPKKPNFLKFLQLHENERNLIKSVSNLLLVGCTRAVNMRFHHFNMQTILYISSQVFILSSTASRRKSLLFEEQCSQFLGEQILHFASLTSVVFDSRFLVLNRLVINRRVENGSAVAAFFRFSLHC
mgnify:CR=1 FL=1